MEVEEYFNAIKEGFEEEYDIATSARKKGLDPEDFVEISPTPGLAERVEGIIGIKGLSKIIRRLSEGRNRTQLAFSVAKEICESDSFSIDPIKRIEIAVKVATAILTEGVLVAPTEGIQGIEHMKNADGSDYIAIIYAGPIRSAGGTPAALSVAVADYARRILGIGEYKPTRFEVERYVEEVNVYVNRILRIQYIPTDEEIREVVNNCSVCISGLFAEREEVSSYRNIKVKTYDGKEVTMPNRVRSGMPIIISTIPQKARKLQKELKSVGMEWQWLERLIKVEKGSEDSEESRFLSELVAGRPILAYPSMKGGFRARYGRSRITGLAAMGVNPATMIILKGFLAVGTQMKMDIPRKGTVVMPVDSIEGPFVVLDDGEAKRINKSEEALKLRDRIKKIVCLGDLLIGYGDCKNENKQTIPSSYVEEFWEEELKEKSKEKVDHNSIDFLKAFELSIKYGIPIHPKFLFDFTGLGYEEIEALRREVWRSIEGGEGRIEKVERVIVSKEVKHILESMQVPHKVSEGNVVIEGDYAKSLVSSLGFIDERGFVTNKEINEEKGLNGVELVNKVSPFKIPVRSYYLAARIGRPEKAKERMMKPAPNVLFPIGSYGGSERNISKAYVNLSKKFRKEPIEVETVNLRCGSCGSYLASYSCDRCGTKAIIEKTCQKCGAITDKQICPFCGSQTKASRLRSLDLIEIVNKATKKLGLGVPQMLKGVKGLTSKDKCPEIIEKGILRSVHGLYVFKDGTIRFDSTNAPMTHFYPKEINISVEKLRNLGYTKDAYGNELESEDQLVELLPQDIVVNKRCIEYLFRAARFVDDELEKIYGMERYYNLSKPEDLIGKLVITLAPHTSCGVLNRIIGYTSARVCFAHPFTISARRRNCDGDEDTTMLLLDALINFSKKYLPSTVGGTMDAPIVLMIKVVPEEVDPEVHAQEVVSGYGIEFYRATQKGVPYSEIKVESIKDRMEKGDPLRGFMFTHNTSLRAIEEAPLKSKYVELPSMEEKIEEEFLLMDMICAVDRRDAAAKLISSHFIPDLMGNLHSFSKQNFRCSVCNTKYRRMPIIGKCPKDGGKLLLTISKGGIEKYMEIAIRIAERYEVDPYIYQRLILLRNEINDIFEEEKEKSSQFDLTKFL
ncbi:MAG: DNA polymerase II large subunit [Candidatus Micrarchaeaceae archaeon]